MTDRARILVGKGRRVAVIAAASAGLAMAGWAGAAFAVSGGGYSGYQQGCQPGDSDYATPQGQTYAGCHNTALNVESGGTTNGAPNDSNTQYAQVGIDQAPNDKNSQGTPTPYSLGEPGMTGSPHAGCIAANTDGTNGQAAPASQGPESSGQAQQGDTACQGNSNGAGVAVNFDYYQYYCPIATMLGAKCEDTTPGNTTVAPNTGNTVDYQPVVDNGVLIYFGMDDNSDNGEHDGVGPYSTGPTGPYSAPPGPNCADPTGKECNQSQNAGAMNNSSDGGAIMILVTPKGITNTPSQSNPEGLANASSGFCADGICFEATTQQQTVYHGCHAPDANGDAPCDTGTPQNANVYDYAPGGNPNNDPSVNNESADCNAGDPTTAGSGPGGPCAPGGMDAYRSATPANENAEPGVQLYSDPDPQRSPAAPSPLWPTPALYIGTCGVYAGSPATTGQVFGIAPMPAGPVPVTNAAGQVAIDPNPSVC